VAGGDTLMTAVGGGTFASRGLTIAGEAVLDAARKLVERIAAVRAATKLGDAPLSEIAAIMNYKQHLLPPGFDAGPTVTGHAVMQQPFLLANGVQASLVEVDPQTGFVKLLKHWVVEDCGRVVNPLLADEQLRGGVVQGIGAALYEESLYDESAQLLNGSMADYLVPMAGEMPDITIVHVETPVQGVFYQSNPKFTGSDEVAFEVKTAEGTTQAISIKITVGDKPATAPKGKDAVEL